MNEIITLINCIASVVEKKNFNRFKIIIQAMLTMRGRITMKGLSRWSETGGSYSSINRFFHCEIDWLTINWLFIKNHLINLGTFLLIGDEVVVTKSGEETYGVDRFFSSLQNQVVKSISFLNISLVSVFTRKAYSILTEQIVKKNKDGCIKDKSPQTKIKKNDSKSKKSNKKRGRPKGSKNKNRKDIEFLPYLSFVQNSIFKVLGKINKFIPLIYFVFDGAFGNNNAVQMVLQTGLHLISKLRRDSALCFKFEGEQKAKGAKKKYGDKIDYDNIPEKYLKQTTMDKNKIETNIYQMEMLHKSFADILNIVVIVKRDVEKKKIAHTILFSTNLNLDYEKIIDYYSLRFQIEFIFRDAKQYWGLEDFMNIREKPVHNFANLSTFMVNFSHAMNKELGNEKMSVINLKAHFHGLKYVNEVLKLVPKITDNILINIIYKKITSIGAISDEKKVD